MVLFNAVKNRIIDANIGNGVVALNIGSPGGSMIKKTLAISEWNAYLEDKISRGYTEIQSKTGEKKKYSNPVLEMLAQKSRQIVNEAYKMSVMPTKEQISSAKEVLDELSMITDLSSFNETLLKLFGLIPRKMKNPILYTAKNRDDYKDILEREDSLLNNLESISDPESDDEHISFEDCSKEETQMIYRMLDKATASKFVRAYRVSNKERDDAFKQYIKDTGIKATTLLFHGSKTENWYSIIKTGLKCNPINVVITGKMFGNGIYFAPKADKANGYTSLSGSRWAKGHDDKAYLGIFEVGTGKEFKTDKWISSYSAINERSFKSDYPDYNSFHALAGTALKNDEVIVYNNAASRIRYLIEVS